MSELETSRTVVLDDEQRKRFAYYLRIAINQVGDNERLVNVLTENFYENPAAVLGELHDWLMAPVMAVDSGEGRPSDDAARQRADTTEGDGRG